MIRKSLLPLVVILMCACAVSYYAPFDAETETRLLVLQSRIDFFYVTAKAEFASGGISEEAVYTFYCEALEEVGYLSNRAESFLNNKDTVHELELLRESLVLAEELHLEGFSSTAEIELIQSALASHFRALISLERAKQRREI